ncbi:MAG: hypothetical protein ABSG53_08090 [Thermoguttaceae bacterium]|jgi:hypothetical protein
MDHPSARRQRLWEAMESCRGGTDDLSDPQFADLADRLAEDLELRGQFQRLQLADEAIKAAFGNVSVPAGLANRVSRRLAESAPTATSGSVSAAAEQFKTPPLTAVAMMTSDGTVTSSDGAVTTSDRPTPLRKSTERFSRRRLLVGFTALSAAAALLAAVWIQIHQPRRDTPESVLADAMDFFDFDKDNQPFGDSDPRKAPPAEYPMSRDIVPLQNVHWRHVEKFPGGPAVAYDLPTNGGRATLYVVERTIPGLPSIPPSPLSTGGKSAGAWQGQGGNTLYILVVEGNAEMYSRCLRPPGPLA